MKSDCIIHRFFIVRLAIGALREHTPNYITISGWFTTFVDGTTFSLTFALGIAGISTLESHIYDPEGLDR